MIKSHKYSIIFPVHNEEQILRNEIVLFINELNKIINSYEVILVENGSTDNTIEITDRLQEEFEVCDTIHLPRPDPGMAVKTGVLAARGDVVITQEVDNWNISFIKKALELLSEYDVVQLTKKTPESEWVNASILRKTLTNGLNFLLKYFFKFKGTETHGCKAYKRDKLIDIVKNCSYGWGMYRTEFRLRCQYSNIKLIEFPYSPEEIRPGRINIILRFVKNMYYLILLYIKLKKEKIIPKS
ncbi:MAG: glycosyltransferase family 2 protein [Colwellia sp.]|nr:glycosyltransferase family 2 protein [Colwellia sp.]